MATRNGVSGAKARDRALEPATRMTTTDRIEALRRFYSVLDRLSTRGLRFCISEARLFQTWPSRGVYFVFEPGQRRSDTGPGPRVVRVGTHALKRGSVSSLRSRIVQHRGRLYPPGGNHRGSIFRLLVGLALARRDPTLTCASWGIGANAPADVRAGESELEAAVSETIGRMDAVLLPVEDEPGPASLRGFLERNAIALLSNLGREPLDPVSEDWLGACCPRARVQGSGLWNNNHVDEAWDSSFLNVFERLAATDHCNTVEIVPAESQSQQRSGLPPTSAIVRNHQVDECVSKLQGTDRPVAAPNRSLGHADRHPVLGPEAVRHHCHRRRPLDTR
jgi:hypothetical protein